MRELDFHLLEPRVVQYFCERIISPPIAAQSLYLDVLRAQLGSSNPQLWFDGYSQAVHLLTLFRSMTHVLLNYSLGRVHGNEAIAIMTNCFLQTES